MITLTESAINAVRTAVAGAASPVQGIRIKVEAGGCAGFKYLMGLVPAAEAGDVVIDHGDVKVFVDSESEPHLKGTVVDFIVGLENSGFNFTNPNAQNACSCGKSFG
jgi:iron-sulfur cluster assembly accessory protein